MSESFWPRRTMALVLVVLAAACEGGGKGSPVPEGSAPSASASVPTASVTAEGSPSAATPPAAPPPVDPAAPFGVVDLHVDTPYQVHIKHRPIDLPEGHATDAALVAGHYIGIVYPIYIADYLNKNHPRVEDAEAIFSTIQQLVLAHPKLLHAAGVESAAPLTAYFSIEGAGAFADDIPAIDRFIARGVRLVGVVHAHDNALATSATGKDRKHGLSEAGRAFCRRVYAAGALVDVSHMSDAAFADLVPIAAEFGAPIVATHSNARAIAKHKRNLTDEQLRIIAETGGVAGLNFHSPYVRTKGKAKLADLVAHAKHMIEVAGIVHVAIGSDFDGGKPVKGLDDASHLPDLGDALLAAGLSREDVHAIFSGNALRVLGWKPPPR